MGQHGWYPVGTTHHGAGNISTIVSGGFIASCGTQFVASHLLPSYCLPPLLPSRYIEIGIEAGVPVSLNGEALSPATLLEKANEIGARHGVGRIDMVENRLVGMKSKGVYETLGGTILMSAARELEALVLNRKTMQTKDMLALNYAELVYAGR